MPYTIHPWGQLSLKTNGPMGQRLEHIEYDLKALKVVLSRAGSYFLCFDANARNGGEKHRIILGPHLFDHFHSQVTCFARLDVRISPQKMTLLS